MGVFVFSKVENLNLRLNFTTYWGIIAMMR